MARRARARRMRPGGRAGGWTSRLCLVSSLRVANGSWQLAAGAWAGISVDHWCCPVLASVLGRCTLLCLMADAVPGLAPPDLHRVSLLRLVLRVTGGQVAHRDQGQTEVADPC